MASNENPKAIPAANNAQTVSSVLSITTENKDPLKVEETLNRLQHHKGVLGVLIVNSDGSVVRSSMDNVQTIQYSSMMGHLSQMARNTVRDLDPENDLRIFRIKTRKHEIMVAPGTFALTLSQDLSDNYCAESR